MKNDILCQFVVFIVAFLVYSNTLKGDYVHDDVPALLKNKDVQENFQWGNLWKNDFWGNPMASNASHKSYRPVTVLIFKIEHLLFGNNAPLSHLINIVLHGIVCVQLFNTLLHIVLGNLRDSLCATLLFITHPIHTEAVANLVGRAELLSCMFYLFAFGRFVTSTEDRSRDSIFPVFETLLLVTIGTLCKENCITIVGIITLHEIVKLRKQLPSKNAFSVLIRLSILWAGSAIFMHERLRIMDWRLPKFAVADNPTSFQASRKVRILTYSYIVFMNFRLLVFPDTLCYDWSYDTIPLVRSYYDVRNILTISFAFCLFISSLWSLHQFASNSKNNDILCGLAFLVFPFIPASNLFFPVGFVIAERTLYIPSIGFVILQTKLMTYFWNTRAKQVRYLGWFIISLLLVLYSHTTMRRNLDWENKKNLYFSAVNTFPNNAKIRYNWANVLRDSGCEAEAIDEYKIVLKLHPTYTGALNNLALLLESNDVVGAEEMYVRLIRIQPLHEQAYRNLANLMTKKNDYNSAINVLSKLLQLKNDNTEYALELADFLLVHNLTEKSRIIYHKLSSKFCNIDGSFFKAANLLCKNTFAKMDKDNSMCISNKSQVCHVMLGLAVTSVSATTKASLKFLDMCLQILPSQSPTSFDTAAFILQHSDIYQSCAINVKVGTVDQQKLNI